MKRKDKMSYKKNEEEEEEMKGNAKELLQEVV